MFKKVLLRSLVGTTALGSALAMSVVAGPATVTTAPEIRTVACDYPANVTTTTDITLNTPVALYGAFNTATATVSAGEGTPEGTVEFTVTRDDTTVGTWSRTLNANGKATISLPRYLNAQATYTIEAAYVPTECSEFKPSEADPAANLSVYKRGTSLDTRAPHRARGQRPYVAVSVDSGLPRDAAGKVRIIIKRAGKVRANRVVRLSDGSARAVFRKMAPGKFSVQTRYLGTRNFSRSTDTNGFVVRRR